MSSKNKYSDVIEGPEDGESDYSEETDTYDSSEHKNNKSSDPEIHENINNIITEGLNHSDYKKMSKDKISNLAMCSNCQKYYNTDFFVALENDDDICQHCFFWINYDEDSRLNIDKKYSNFGITVANYVITCHQNHNFETCTRRTDTGGCLLCDYKLGIPIQNILNPELLYPPELSESKNQLDEPKEEPDNPLKFVESGKRKIQYPMSLSI